MTRNNYIEVEAKTVAEAIKQAIELLKVSKEDEIEIKVLSEEKMGLFGRAGGRRAKIRAWIKKKNA